MLSKNKNFIFYFKRLMNAKLLKYFVKYDEMLERDKSFGRKQSSLEKFRKKKKNKSEESNSGTEVLKTGA